MNSSNFTQKPIHRTSQSYVTGDPIPVAEVQELDSDTAWGLFDGLAAPNAHAQPDSPAFAATAAAELEPLHEPSQPTPSRK